MIIFKYYMKRANICKRDAYILLKILGDKYTDATKKEPTINNNNSLYLIQQAMENGLIGVYFMMQKVHIQSHNLIYNYGLFESYDERFKKYRATVKTLSVNYNSFRYGKFVGKKIKVLHSNFDECMQLYSEVSDLLKLCQDYIDTYSSFKGLEVKSKNDYEYPIEKISLSKAFKERW